MIPDAEEEFLKNSLQGDHDSGANAGNLDKSMTPIPPSPQTEQAEDGFGYLVGWLARKQKRKSGTTGEWLGISTHIKTLVVTIMGSEQTGWRIYHMAD